MCPSVGVFLSISLKQGQMYYSYASPFLHFCLISTTFLCEINGVQPSVGKKMAAVHTNLTQPIKYKESPLFAIFVTVLMTLCKLGLKMLALFCTFLVRLELWVNVPVAIFLPTVDCTVHLALFCKGVRSHKSKSTTVNGQMNGFRGNTKIQASSTVRE